jgi:hypothetical protein
MIATQRILNKEVFFIAVPSAQAPQKTRAKIRSTPLLCLARLHDNSGLMAAELSFLTVQCAHSPACGKSQVQIVCNRHGWQGKTHLANCEHRCRRKSLAGPTFGLAFLTVAQTRAIVALTPGVLRTPSLCPAQCVDATYFAQRDKSRIRTHL